MGKVVRNKYRKSIERAANDPKGVVIYHDMRVYDDFERCAHALFDLVKRAQEVSPGSKRVLFLDIQGHRNSAGGYNSDAFGILQDFCLGSLSPYITEIHTPMYIAKNPKAQNNDIPEKLIISYDSGHQPLNRDQNPSRRRSPPSINSIARYYGMDPCCMICWKTPVERAHARPKSLEGSYDIRNFALLCNDHHKRAPDVRDSNAFWFWVDWMVENEGFFSKKRQYKTDSSLSFFQQVKQELVDLYGWSDKDVENFSSDLMAGYFKILEQDTTKHFGLEKKVSTHAWAFNEARRLLSTELGKN